jgi:hypothetical protein
VFGGEDGLPDPREGLAAAPLAEREQQITELEDQIDQLQRTEEAIVVATGAPREAGCPPRVVLGVTAIKSHGGRRRVTAHIDLAHDQREHSVGNSAGQMTRCLWPRARRASPRWSARKSCTAR